MAKIRDEVVGKRFLSVSGGSKLKLSKIREWDWRAGIVRACTHTDAKHPDLQVRICFFYIAKHYYNIIDNIVPT